MKTVGIIGYGNMGSAFCRGLKAKSIPFAVAEKKQERLKALKDEQGLDALPLPDLAAAAETLILAVKPQEIAALAKENGPLAAGKRLISIIAGKPIAYFAAAFKTDMVCRFMPNLAALAGKAAVGVSFAAGAAPGFRDDCLEIARAIGEPFELPEPLLAAFTGLSGSGIAYVFAFLHALSLGGTAAGINYDDSLRIALATCDGAVAALRATGANPTELITRVVSPAGTTIRGLKRLEIAGFTGAVLKAVEDAAERARELER